MAKKRNLKNWVSVTEHDSWGNISTFLGSQYFATSGNKILVRFPDGTEETLPVEIRQHVEHVSDKGHESLVTSDVPVVTLNHHGVKIDLRLGSLKVKVSVDENGIASA